MVGHCANGPVIDNITPTKGFCTTDASHANAIVAHSPAGVAQVTVNGNAAQDSGNNTWSYVAPLSVGLNVFTVIVTDNADLTVTGRIQYVRSTASAGLLGHWTFDGGNAKDVSGNGNNGVIIGATVASGVSGEAYHFDGNSRIEVGNLSFDTQEYTVNGWIRTTDPGVDVVTGFGLGRWMPLREMQPLILCWVMDHKPRRRGQRSHL